MFYPYNNAFGYGNYGCGAYPCYQGGNCIPGGPCGIGGGPWTNNSYGYNGYQGNPCYFNYGCDWATGCGAGCGGLGNELPWFNW